MQHPFAALRPEYEALLARMVITRTSEVDATAKRLLQSADRYRAVQAKTGVPALWLMAIGEREAGPSIFHRYFGNGDPLNRPTTHVPRNRGPFYDPGAWEKGTTDALHLDHIDQVMDWSWPRACYEGEAWNGFGPRAHGIHTGYLWSGSDIYTHGKYVADGVWSASERDQQLGIVPVMRRIVELDPSLDLAGLQPIVDAPPTAPTVPLPPPVGVHDAYALQAALNSLGADPALLVDGSYGIKTKRAVRAFQTAAHITVDGLAGPETWAAIDARLIPART